MANVVVSGDTSGAITIAAPAVAGTNTLTLPASTGTLVATGGAQTIEFAAGTVSAPSITTTGDTNTGIFFPAADTIAFTEGGAEAMRIDSSGNVGINTTSPGVKLGVVDTSAGAATFPAIFGNRGTTVSTQANIGLQTYDAGSAGITNVIGSVTTSATGGAGSADMVFQTTASGTRAERMRIDSSGNVGIDTSSPSSFTAENDSKLIVGNGSGNNGITVYTGNTAQGGIFFADGTSGAATYSGILRYNHSANAMLFYTNGLNERMRIDSSGNLLIGTTSQLTGHLISASTVSGQLWGFGPYSGIGNNFYVSYNGNTGVYLVGGGTSWSSNSDERLKADLLPIEDASNKVCSLRAVTGRYKTDAEGVSRSFLIAQDVQKVLPEAVNVQVDEQGTLGVAYTDVIPLLVAAIKELNTKVEAQAAESQEQQQIINDLKARIETLENK